MTFHEQAPSRPPAQTCCDAPMTLVRIDPKVSSFPELRTFRCGICGDIRTVEVGPISADASDLPHAGGS